MHTDLSDSPTRLKEFISKAYENFLKIRGAPKDIALGLALGLFIGMTPTLGFQMVIAVFFAALFKWNKISAGIGVWITNPITAPFIYGSTYIIGAKLIGIEQVFNLKGPLELNYLLELFQKAPNILAALVFGGIIVGIPLSVIAYFVSLKAITKYQEDIKLKLALKKEKLKARMANNQNKKKKKRNSKKLKKSVRQKKMK